MTAYMMFTETCGWVVNMPNGETHPGDSKESAAAEAFRNHSALEAITVLDGAGRTTQVIHRNLSAA